jgi:hypothetical protein
MATARATASQAVTMNTYSHVAPALQRDAAERMRVLFAPSGS